MGVAGLHDGRKKGLLMRQGSSLEVLEYNVMLNGQLNVSVLAPEAYDLQSATYTPGGNAVVRVDENTVM